MAMIRAKHLALGLGIGLILAATSRSQPPDPDLARLLKGAIVVRTERDPATKDFLSVGKVIFPAPLELVWQTLTNYNGYPGFLSDVTVAKVDRKEGNQSTVRLSLRNVWPLPDYQLVLLMEETPETGGLKFSKQEGDFAKYYGSWKLTRLDSARTLAEYRLYQYVGWYWFPFVPNPLGNNSAVSTRLEDFRKCIRDLQIEKSLEPGKVIKPLWRKSIFKGKEKPAPTAPQPKPSPPDPKP